MNCFEWLVATADALADRRTDIASDDTDDVAYQMSNVASLLASPALPDQPTLSRRRSHCWAAPNQRGYRT